MGCGSKDDTTANKVQMPVPNVKITQPLTQDVTEWDDYTGRIEAVSSVDIRARVSGYLEKVNFKAGEPVKKGDLLFQIDPKPFVAQLSFAEAELERAKAKHELAKNDLERAKRLISGKAISEEEHDARTKGSQETLAAVQSATANVATAKLNLEFTKIRAPIDGRIGRELITEGNLVSGGGADATLLTFIVSIDPIYVYVDVDERSALKYRRLAIHDGNRVRPVPVQLAVADDVDFPHLGHIDYISPKADITTGTVSLRGVLANADGLLSPGFFARLRVRGSAPYSALLIPDRAIATDQAQRFVWVVNQEQKVEYRKVLLGTHVGQLRVITEGLKADDSVVIEGIQKLMPDLQVNAESISLVEPKGEK
ncbi:MAG: efflux RND transporter periplasmic adaptor subunit [Methylococcales bacterium]|nr:efflux RND transporter periplasmic adaptor subunit [Methylococcales bacterium]